MPQAATNGIEWLHSAFVFIRCTLGCIVHCINSSYSKYSLLKKASETSISFVLANRNGEHQRHGELESTTTYRRKANSGYLEKLTVEQHQYGAES